VVRDGAEMDLPARDKQNGIKVRKSALGCLEIVCSCHFTDDRTMLRSLNSSMFKHPSSSQG